MPLLHAKFARTHATFLTKFPSASRKYVCRESGKILPTKILSTIRQTISLATLQE